MQSHRQNGKYIKFCENCENEYKTLHNSAKFCSKLCSFKYRKTHKEEFEHSYFKKGQVSWNKGLKRTWFSPAEFKKGNVPVNKLSLGTILIKTSKKNGTRRYIKTAEPNVWKPYSVYLWESENSNVPKGFVVHHKNFNMLDDKIENLTAISRAEHAKIHGLKPSGRNEKFSPCSV
jgi:hypothetical protein